ncbi:MAG: hypothetical protein ACTTKL_04235 [Treponema sp.]
MKSVYIVTEIADGIIKVSPVSTSNPNSKSTGKETTAKNSPRCIQVANPRSLPIECGSAVHIGFSKTAEALRGLSALLVPILAAGAALYLAPSAASALHLPPSPNFKAAFTSACFLVSAAAVFFISRRADITVEPHITSLA